MLSPGNSAEFAGNSAEICRHFFWLYWGKHSTINSAEIGLQWWNSAESRFKSEIWKFCRNPKSAKTSIHLELSSIYVIEMVWMFAGQNIKFFPGTTDSEPNRITVFLACKTPPNCRRSSVFRQTMQFWIWYNMQPKWILWNFWYWHSCMAFLPGPYSVTRTLISNRAIGPGQEGNGFKSLLQFGPWSKWLTSAIGSSLWVEHQGRAWRV